MAVISHIFDYLPLSRLIDERSSVYLPMREHYRRKGYTMSTEPSVFPVRMLEELSRLRAASVPNTEVEQRPKAKAPIEKSIDIIERAAEFMKAKAADALRFEQETTALKQENAALISMCDQAHTAIQELKRQLDAQTARAETAEHYVRRLESQLNASEAAARESKASIEHLTDVIEAAFGSALTTPDTAGTDAAQNDKTAVA